MKKTRDLMVLAMEAYRQGQYEGCAKFFAEAMGSDDLNSFVDYIAQYPDGTALHGDTESNTFAPSLSSTSSDVATETVIKYLNDSFLAEMSSRGVEPDEEIEEVEVRASFEDDDDAEDARPVSLRPVSIGPVRFR